MEEQNVAKCLSCYIVLIRFRTTKKRSLACGQESVAKKGEGENGKGEGKGGKNKENSKDNNNNNTEDRITKERRRQVDSSKKVLQYCS